MFNIKPDKPTPNKNNASFLNQQSTSLLNEQAVLAEQLIAQEKAYRYGVVNIRDLISPASLEIKPKYLLLNGQYVSTIFIVAYPRYISVGWFAPILNLNESFDISMFFYPINSAIVLKQLKNKVGVLEAQISADADKGNPRDPIRETALRDVET